MKLNLPKTAALFAGALGLLFSADLAVAGSATWSTTPSTVDWALSSNWVQATVPNSSTDVATFNTSNVTTLHLSINIEINTIDFVAGANSFNFTPFVGTTLTISGTGITNNSGVTQTFITTSLGGNFGQINFTNGATAGTLTGFINTGSVVANIGGGFLDFFGTSTGGSASITNNGTSVVGGFGGHTSFVNSSTAGSATIANNGGSTTSGSEGYTAFGDNASAGSATINNNATTASGSFGGETLFGDSATAGSAHINNEGAAVAGSDASGHVVFAGSATAGNATMFNGGASLSGTAGGEITFEDQTNAGTASIENFNGVANGFTRFSNSSSASGSFIVNDGGAAAGELGGDTSFSGTATAASATITNNASQDATAGAGITEFNGTSKAGSASITNLGAVGIANGGGTNFHDTSSADNATITNNGSMGGLAGAGGTKFTSSSKAGSATITSNGGAGAGAGGGFTYFLDTSAASNATLIARGGTSGGLGGLILIANNATGGTARVEVFGNGELDISQHNSPGVTIGSVEGSGNVFLGARNLTVGSNNLSTTFSGVIQNGGIGGGTGGSLTKIGTGTLILSGANTYTGETDINAGVLQVDGSISSTTFVNAGGTLAGSGTIASASVINSGIVSPGTSPGTLTIGGGYGQTSAGTLRIEIAGLSLAQHDLLSVGTAASLNGTLQVVQLNNFQPANGARVTFLTDNGGHTGTFATVTSNFGLLQPVVHYDEPNDVYLIFQLGSFNIGGLTPNQKSVALNLNNAANDPAAAGLINFLVGEPLGALPHDYDLIAPEELASIYEIGFSQAVVQNNNLQRRMDDIRAGSNGFCANGFTPQVSGKDYTKESDGKVSLPDKNTRDVYTPAPDNRWGVFVTGTGDFVNVGNDDFNARGYDITTGDFTVGADYRLCDHFAIGIDAGYSRSNADLVDDGRVEVDGGKIGAYATVFGKGLFGSKFYVDGGVGGGLNSYDTRRTGLQDELVRGSTNGSELNAFIAYGSDWTFGCFNIGTWSTVQYTNVSIDQFTETGSLAPLEIQDQDENSFRATTGFHASYDIKAGHAIFRPEVRVAYQHEYCDSAYQIDSRLASGAGDVFRVRGPNIGRDAALVGAGMSMQWNNRLSTYVYYDGVLGRNNYDNNAVSGGFRIGF